MCKGNIASLQGAVLRPRACPNSFTGNKLEIFRLGPTSNNQDSLNLRKLPLSALYINSEAETPSVDCEFDFF
jgi:hypothetical protein